MKVAILYICTGNYNIFWDEFYISCERFFLNKTEKHYFVFSDNDRYAQMNDHITFIPKICRGFPYDSLFRFEMFLEIETQIMDYDHVFFFNSNMLFLKNVNEEVLPSKDSNGLVGVLHPGYFNVKSNYFPFERNKKSLAYIPKVKNHKYNYFMGGFNGGRSKEFLNLIRCCAKNIQIDYDKGIVARYHDESHINRYFFDHTPFILSSAYGFPEGLKTSFDPKIIIRDKVLIDPIFRKQSLNIFTRVKNRLKLEYYSLIWKL